MSDFGHCNTGLSQQLKFWVVPRPALGRFEFPSPYAVIAISNALGEGTPLPSAGEWKAGAPREILELAFLDIDLLDTHGSNLSCAIDGATRVAAMRENHASSIAAFLRRQGGQVQNIIVSCELGLSRSPSIAMAIVDEIELTRGCIEWWIGGSADGTPPNRYVYELTRHSVAEFRPFAR